MKTPPSVFRHPVFGPSGPAGESAPATVPLSMIDVVFLLLIFLLLGQFPLAEGLLSVPLAGASAGAADPAPARTLWVRVQAGADGALSYRLNDWPASRSASELLGHVRDWVSSAGADRLAVVVAAEPGVPFEKMVELWEGCRRMGVRRLALPGGPAEGAGASGPPQPSR